jgi:hypothetical protein
MGLPHIYGTVDLYKQKLCRRVRLTFLFLSFFLFFSLLLGIYELDLLAQSYRLRDELDFSLYLALIILLFW